MNTKKVIAFILLAAGGYFVYRHFSQAKGKPKQPGDNTPDDAVKQTATSAKPAIAQYFPLKKGSDGQKVIELQQAILSVSPTALPKYGADGDFGSETEAAVKMLLGKTTIDSQDDIVKILSVKLTKEAADKLAQQKNSRKALAQKLIGLFGQKKGNSFYAIHDTGGEIGNYTSDGRLVKESTKVWKKGDVLLNDRIPVEFSVNADGFILAKQNGKYYYFSPYGVEVK